MKHQHTVVFNKYLEEAEERYHELDISWERWTFDVVTYIKCACFIEPETQFSPTLFRVDLGLGNSFIKNQAQGSDCQFIPNEKSNF